MTEENFLVIDANPFTDWAVDLANYFYLEGSLYQTLYFRPRLQAKQDIIGEKDQVIDSLSANKQELERDLRWSNASLGLSEMRAEGYKAERDEAIENAAVWRRRFWGSVGISVGVVGVAGLTAYLLN